jgi:F420-non-reducing hydrogenase iron-sulfur subunit
MDMLKKLLEELGFDSRRFRREWISGAEGKKFAEVITEFTAELQELGPNQINGGGK